MARNVLGIARAWLVAASLLAAAASAQAPADIRVALVIGNAAYAGAARLDNAVNDAKAVAQALRALGFEVIELRDAQHAQMAEAVGRLRSLLQGRQGIGLMYYAGHGLQVDWRNYMVPVDARLSSVADVPRSTVEVGQVIEALRAAGTRMNIVVLDACRDNPFPAQSGGRGLAPQDAPSGTFLAYSTAPGNVALDGDAGSANSLYTAALVGELQKPEARIEDVFKRVRLQVRQKTQGKQIPWESTSLEDDFVFNTGKLLRAVPPDSRAREQQYAAQKADWDRIKDKATADDLYAFLQKHPQGSFSELVQAKLELLQKPQVVVQPGPDGKPMTPSHLRYRPGDTYTLVNRDGLTGLEIGRGTMAIRYLGPDEFVAEALAGNIAGGRSNSAGFILEDGGGSYDPPWSVVPGGDLQVGRKASGRSMITRRNGSKEWVDYDTRVVAREKIQTEAFGAVETYRVEVTFVYQSGSRSLLTFWFDPDWGYSIRQRVEVRRGTVPDIRVRELVARTRKG